MTFTTSLGLRSHLVKKHLVCEWEADEAVLRNWIRQKVSSGDKQASSLNGMELVCSWCQQAFNEFNTFYDHLHAEHLVKSFNKYCEIVDTFKGGSISCGLCDSLFNTVSAFTSHSKLVHSSEAIRVCLLCDEECNGERALLRHINHHVLGMHKCTICPSKYSTQRQFTNHLESFHQNKYSVKCTQCFSSFKTYASYEQHKNADHQEVKQINSDPVIESVTDVVEVEVESTPSTHKLKDEGKEMSIGRFCDLCNMSFSYKTQYQRHLYSIHPTLFNYRCEECECLFKNFGALISHQMSHIFGVHHCPRCNIKFSLVDQIKKHITFSHPFIKGLECKLCIKIFKTYDTYLNHLKLKHPEASGNAIVYVDCKVCGKKFSNAYQLQLHKRNHEISLSVCNICNARVKHLSFHMNSHTKAEKFPCKECGVTYNSKASLSFHCKRTHLGDSAKKFTCDECRKKFLCANDLRTHIARVHRGERKFICKYCDKAYKNKVSLSYHERKHTGQKPHECTLCKMAFEIPTMLRQHIEKDHNAVYKGIYFKKNSSSKQCEKKVSQSDIVHINVPPDMRKEVVSSSFQPDPTEDKIIVVVDC